VGSRGGLVAVWRGPRRPLGEHSLGRWHRRTMDRTRRRHGRRLDSGPPAPFVQRRPGRGSPDSGGSSDAAGGSNQ
jgi:hypothetical protein